MDRFQRESIRRSLFSAILIFASTPLAAQEKTPPPRKDLHGDPMPQGALARLGTVRYHNSQEIHTAAFAPDGDRQTLLVFAREYPNSALRLWNIGDGKELAHFALKDAQYPDAWYTRGVCFTPDGKGIVLRRENLVEVIDRQSGKILHTLKADVKFRSMALSPDGKVLALASRAEKEVKTTTIFLWEIATGKQIPWLKLDSDWFFGLHFSADGKRLLTASVPHGENKAAVVQVWEVGSGKKLHEVTVDNYFYVAFSPDGRFVATQKLAGPLANTKEKEDIRVVQVDNGATVCQITPPPCGRFASHAFTPDGKALITIANEQTPCLWDAATGKQILAFAGLPAGWVEIGGFSADGKRFALIVGQAVRFWNVETGAEIRRYDGHVGPVSAVAFSPNGKLLASGSQDTTVRLWEPGTGREVRCLKGHKEGVLALAFSPDGATLASASTDGTTRLWRVADGTELRMLDGPGRAGRKGPGYYNRDGMKLVFAADGKTLHAVDDEFGYCAWDVASGRTLKRKQFGEGKSRTIGLSHDAATVLAYRGLLFDGTENEPQEAMSLWDVATGKRELTLPRRLAERKSHDLDCIGAELSGDGRLLAGSSRFIFHFEPLSSLYGDPAVRIWERLSGREILTIDNYSSALVFSPDGKILAGNCRGMEPHGYDFFYERMGSIFLWDTLTGKTRQEFGHHTAQVNCVAFAPDGKTLASGSADHTILIWDCAKTLADEAPLPKPTAKELDVLWDSLVAEDALKARQAMAQLVRLAAPATELLAARLKPATEPDAKQLAVLIANLSNRQFPTRQKAAETLAELGDVSLPALEKALAARPDEVTRQRLEIIVGKATNIGYRKIRAVAVLEQIADDAAVRVLQTLGKGIPESRQTAEAQISLRRLGK